MFVFIRGIIDGTMQRNKNKTQRIIQDTSELKIAIVTFKIRRPTFTMITLNFHRHHYSPNHRTMPLQNLIRIEIYSGIAWFSLR